jgi:hypothetical protein
VRPVFLTGVLSLMWTARLFLIHRTKIPATDKVMHMNTVLKNKEI